MTRLARVLPCACIFIVFVVCAGAPVGATRYLAITPETLWEWETGGMPDLFCPPCRDNRLQADDVLPAMQNPPATSKEPGGAAAYDLDRGLLYSPSEMSENPDLSPVRLLYADAGAQGSLRDILENHGWVVFESSTGELLQRGAGSESGIVIEGNGTRASFSFGCTMTGPRGGEWALLLLVAAAAAILWRRVCRRRFR